MEYKLLKKIGNTETNLNDFKSKFNKVKLIHDESNLPEAIEGVIQLEDNTTEFMMETISIADPNNQGRIASLGTIANYRLEG